MIKKEKLSSSVLRICDHLKKCQFQAFIVGGSIRDLLIGNIPTDWDVATDAMPETVMKIFDRDFRVIPTGLHHGTVTIVMDNDNIEITTFRTEGDYLDGRRPSQVSFVNSIEKDLSRRDLTINSIAYDPISDKIIDPFNGIGDIQRKIIRMVGDPHERMQEDGLRLIRIYRFSSQLGYSIDKNTTEAIPYHFETFKKVANERITAELIKLLNGNSWKIAIYQLYKSGLLNEIIPSFKNPYIQEKLSNPNITRLEGQFRKVRVLLLPAPEQQRSAGRILVWFHPGPRVPDPRLHHHPAVPHPSGRHPGVLLGLFAGRLPVDVLPARTPAGTGPGGDGPYFPSGVIHARAVIVNQCFASRPPAQWYISGATPPQPPD